MPKRLANKTMQRSYDKRLLQKVINFLINRGLMNRRNEFLKEDVFAHLELEDIDQGKDINLSIMHGEEVIESYTVSFGGFSKHFFFTYTERYSKPFTDFMTKWVNYVVGDEAVVECPKPPSYPKKLSFEIV